MSSEVADAMVKITRAIQRGTLAGNYPRINGYDGISVDLATHFHASSELAWYVKHFPDGERRLHRRAAYRNSGRRHNKDWFDRWTYTVRAGRLWVTVYYSLPHECVSWRANSDDRRMTGWTPNDVPIWRCCGCGKPLSITRARELGLSPELVKG